MKFSGSTAALVAQVRDQTALLAQVTRELEPPLHTHVVAALMRGKHLILYVDSSAWASRLRFGSRTLRSRLIDKGSRIEKITVRVTIQSGAKRDRQQNKRHLSRANSILLDKTADDIDDPNLCQALKRLSRHGR